MVNILKTNRQEEIILTEGDKPTIKVSFVEKVPAEEKKTSGKRRFGMAKVFYDSDFWEEHDEKYGRIAMF